jgi:hypothetical protein
MAMSVHILEVAYQSGETASLPRPNILVEDGRGQQDWNDD